jgi:hypothetical protein
MEHLDARYYAEIERVRRENGANVEVSLTCLPSKNE